MLIINNRGPSTPRSPAAADDLVAQDDSREEFFLGGPQAHVTLGMTK
jgi:hypothetical protein